MQNKSCQTLSPWPSQKSPGVEPLSRHSPFDLPFGFRPAALLLSFFALALVFTSSPCFAGGKKAQRTAAPVFLSEEICTTWTDPTPPDLLWLEMRNTPIPQNIPQILSPETFSPPTDRLKPFTHRERLIYQSLQKISFYLREQTDLLQKTLASQKDSCAQGKISWKKKLLLEKLSRSAQFFLQPISSNTPASNASKHAEIEPSTIDKIVEIYLPVANENAAAEFLQTLMPRLMDQQIENPEYYVSHGIDHSLNVVQYVEDTLRNIPDLRKEISKKYGVSGVEAELILKTIALMHDVGYSGLQGRSKALHGPLGADYLESSQVKFLALIQSTRADKPLISQDMIRSVHLHSSDKIEKQFPIKIATLGRTYLSEESGFSGLLTRLRMEKKSVKNLYVHSQERATRLIGNSALMQQIGNIPIIISEEPFWGRSAEYDPKKRHSLGLEYRLADLRKDPLPSAIRLADNMDIMANRLSVIQREPAFLDIVRILGDGKPVSQLLSQLESLENLSPLPSSWQAELIQQSALFQNFQADLNPPEKFKSQHSENGTQTEELVPRIRFTHPIAKTLISTISRSNPLSALRKGDEIKPARKNEAFPQLVSKNASNRGDFLPLQTWEIKVAQQLSNELPQYPNPKIMKRALLGFIANHVLSQKKYEAFTQANAQAKKEISLASLELSSTAYPHFGGTQAITSVALKRSRGKKNPSPYIEVVLNQELYDQLNEVKVKELVFPAPLSSESSRQPPLTSQKSFSDKAPPTEISVEVGRYQIFRFEQALQSIRYSGKSIPIEVVLKSSKKRVRKQSSQKTS